MSRLQPLLKTTSPRLRAALAAAVALALAATGCTRSAGDGAEQAAKPEQAGEASREQRGFLTRLFTPEPVIKQVPAGTALTVRFLDTVSSHQSQPGATFLTEVEEAVLVDELVAIPEGSRVVGTVVEARGPKIGGRARLSLSFHRLELPSGESLPIEAALMRLGRSEKGKDAATIAGSVVGGAILGHQADDAQGKAVGGILGGAIGAAIAAGTKGKPVVVPAGSVVSLEMRTPVSVEIQT